MLHILVFAGLFTLAKTTSTPFPQPAFDEPAQICSQFMPPRTLPAVLPGDFYPGDQLFIRGSYRKAFIAYYATIFCPSAVGPRIGLSFEPQFGDQGYLMQVGLRAAVQGELKNAEAAFSSMANNTVEKGPALFFRGACKWARKNRRGAVADWLVAAAVPGVTQPPEQPVIIPPYVLGSRLMLHKLIGIKAPPWQYGPMYFDR